MPDRDASEMGRQLGRFIDQYIERALQPCLQELAELRRLVDNLEHENRRLKGDLNRRLDDHDRRMNVLSKERTQGRHLVTDAYLVHQDIRKAIESLEGQGLLDLATRHLGATNEQEEAQAIATLAWLLLNPETKALSPRDLTSGLAGAAYPKVAKVYLESVCETAKEIRAKAEASGHDVHWDFGLRRGAPLDPRRQKAFDRCDEAGLAEFVVMPGYSVGGTVYRHQRVFTVAVPGAGVAVPEAEPGAAAEPAAEPNVEDAAPSRAPREEMVIWVHLPVTSTAPVSRFIDDLWSSAHGVDEVVPGPSARTSDPYAPVKLPLRGGDPSERVVVKRSPDNDPDVLEVSGSLPDLTRFLGIVIDAFPPQVSVRSTVDNCWHFITSPSDLADLLQRR